VRNYAVLVAMAAASVAILAFRIRPSRALRPRHLGWLVGGAAAAGLIVWVITLLQGTSPAGLIRGFVLDPLRQPDIFVVPLLLPPWALVLAAVSLGLAIGASWLARTRDLRGVILGLIRLGGGLLMILGAAGPSPFGPYSFALALPLVWLSLELSPPEHMLPAHVLIPSLAVLQTLHAYPVAGSQTAWAIFLLIPVGGIAVAGGQRAVEEALGRAGLKPRLGASLSTIPLLGFALWFGFNAFSQLRYFTDAYRANVALDLPGAGRLRLPQEQVDALRGVTAGLTENCSTFVSLPGLNSFYVFAEEEPPTWLNQSGWMYVFDAELQRRIVSQVDPIGGLCALRNRAMEDLWRQARPLPQRPLVRFIEDTFRPLQDELGYELLVRSGR
jgi:hypothetical protein